MMALLQVGYVVSGVVTSVQPYGAFVDLCGSGAIGLLHVSQVSQDRVHDMHAIFKEGDQVKASLV